MSEGTLSFLIHWLPTLLFVLGLSIAVLLGLWRGLRKSAILWIQAAVLAGIFLIIFFCIAGKDKTDQNVFGIVETFMGKGKLQNMMGVSESCSSFTECFIEFIPKQMSFNDGWKLVLEENGQYLATLADMATRMVIGLFLLIFYWIAVFLFYIIYLIFYPQRRHVRKLEKNYYRNVEKKKNEEAMEARKREEENTTPEIEEPEEIEGEELSEEALAIMNDEESEEAPEEKPEAEAPKEEPVHEKIPPFSYKRRHLFGMLLGGCRGLIEGLVFLSFVGGLFFVLAGGTGNRTVTEVDWEDEQKNLAYDAYSEIGTYGTEGIYKVLNAFHNKENTPYYLFAVDLVFRGGLTDENRNVSENIYLRKELASLTGFAEDTFDLLMKYGSDDIKDCALGKTESQMTDVVISVMTKEGFRTEFEQLIADFRTSTYFVNLSYSFITSFVNHIEELELEETLGTETMELIELLFKKGYYCEDIAYEKYLKDTGSTEVLPYMTPELILNKQDVITIYDMVMEFFTVRNKKYEDSTQETLEIISAILPYINNFTILSDESDDSEMNAVLRRLYVFCQNTYFEDMTENITLTALHTAEEVENPYTTDKYANINWVTEIRGLVTVISDVMALYTNGYETGASVLDNIFNIFNQDNESYTKDIELYDEVMDTIGASFLLGDIFQSNFGSAMLKDALSSFVPDLVLPEINYSNVTNGDGTVTKGEFYWLLRALKAFGENQENKNMINTLTSGEELTEDDYYDLVGDLAGALLEKPTDESVLSSCLKSTIISCVLGEYLCTLDMGNFSLYIDDSILLTDEEGNKVHRIEEEELESFFGNIIDMLTIVKDIDFDTMDTETIIGYVVTEKFYKSMDSKIIEGTASSLVRDMLSDNEIIVLPESLKDKSGYISTDSETSEVKKLIGLYQYPHLNLATLVRQYATEGDQMNGTVGMVKQLDEDDLDAMFDSKILYYSLSQYLFNHSTGLLGGDADLIIPDVAKTTVPEEPEIDEVVTKDVIIDFFMKAKSILPDDIGSMDYDMLISAVVNHTDICQNIILSASMTNAIANSTSLSDALVIPSEYKEAGKKDDLHSYTTSNIWYAENERFFKSLCSMLDLDTRDDLSVNGADFSTAIYTAFSDLNEAYRDTGETRLEVTYDSVIMASSISKRIDEAGILSDAKKAEVKTGGIYNENEISCLVDLIGMFNLSLDSDTILDSAMDNITVLNNAYEKDPSITNLEHLYATGKISGLVITEGVEDASAIPSDAYEDGELYITEHEASGLIASIDDLGLDLGSGDVSVDGTMSVTKILNAMFEYDGSGSYVSCKSLILELNASDQLVTQSNIVVPASDYDTGESRVKPESMYLFLAGVKALGGDTEMQLDSDLTSVKLPDDDASLEAMTNSHILDACMTKSMTFEMDGAEKKIVEDAAEGRGFITVEDTYNGSSRVVIMTQEEAMNTIKAYKVINPDSSMEVTFTLTILKDMTEEKRAVLYNSCAIRCILSESLLSYGYELSPVATVVGTTLAMNVQDYTDTNASYKLMTAIQMEEYVDYLNSL